MFTKIIIFTPSCAISHNRLPLKNPLFMTTFLIVCIRVVPLLVGLLLIKMFDAWREAEAVREHLNNNTNDK